MVLYAQPEYVNVELEAFWRGGVKKACERFKVHISLWEPPDAGLLLLCQSMHTFPFGSHRKLQRLCYTHRRAQRKQGWPFSFLRQNTFPFKSGGDLRLALTFVNEIEQMQTDLISPSSPFSSPA